MNNPFMSSPEERLKYWKDFRENLTEYSEKEQLEKVNEFWNKAPLTNIAYDISNPESWGTPWEMIHLGEWCRYSIAIGMEFTLRLSGWNADRLNLVFAHDLEKEDTIFVLDVDKKFLLNYSLDLVETQKRNWNVIERWQFINNKFEKLEMAFQ